MGTWVWLVLVLASCVVQFNDIDNASRFQISIDLVRCFMCIALHYFFPKAGSVDLESKSMLLDFLSQLGSKSYSLKAAHEIFHLHCSASKRQLRICRMRSADSEWHVSKWAKQCGRLWISIEIYKDYLSTSKRQLINWRIKILSGACEQSNVAG